MDPFAGLKKAKEDYKIYDSHYEKIGKVDDLLVDDNDEVLYVGVKMGFLGTNSTIIPTEILRVNDKRQLIEVSEPADTIKHAPDFKHGDELTPELERHVRSYYGLGSTRPAPEHDEGGAPGPGYDPRLAPDPRVDIAPGERSVPRGTQVPESPAPPSGRSVDIPLDEDVPEFTPEKAPERPSELAYERGSERPPERPAVKRIERPADETEGPAGEAGGRWETEDAGSVRIHRLRR